MTAVHDTFDHIVLSLVLIVNKTGSERVEKMEVNMELEAQPEVYTSKQLEAARKR